MELIAPLSAQIALTLLLLFAMGAARVKAIMKKQVRAKDVALRQPAWPEQATRIGNAFHNQLETPLLFYVLVIILILTKQADSTYLYMAWGFVILRVIHAAIHVSTSLPVARFYIFVLASTVLTLMWLRFFLIMYGTA